ncbi:MAG: P-II family nitrogen regulator [Desulfomonilaceae bacterium]
MVLVEAIIKPFKLDDIKEALEELGVGGITVTELIQTAAQTRGRSFAPTRTAIGLVPKIKIQIAASTELVERIIEAVRIHGSSGKIEDGRVTVEKIDKVVRIRTGELDSDALT